MVALIYRVEHGDGVTWNHAEPLVDPETPEEFRLKVKDKKARFELKVHYAKESEARKAIENYIRIWEFDVCLERDTPDFFRLKFHKAEIVDRNPTPGTTRLRGCLSGVASGSASLMLGPSRYPLPPADICLDDRLDLDVQTMYQRYMGYRRKREPLPSMAYFCLTVLEMKEGGRLEAAKKYQIGGHVLAKVGKLSSHKGGLAARKAEGVGTEMTESDRRFLEQAIRKIIRRVAEKTHKPDRSLPKISLSDFPRT